jgi:hypothetical protein
VRVRCRQPAPRCDAQVIERLHGVVKAIQWAGFEVKAGQQRVHVLGESMQVGQPERRIREHELLELFGSLCQCFFAQLIDDLAKEKVKPILNLPELRQPFTQQNEIGGLA